MTIRKSNRDSVIDKSVDFGRQLFAGVLRSRSGALSELSTLARFLPGTKGFARQYAKLLPLRIELQSAYETTVRRELPAAGLRLGIIDDTGIKKAGKQFPKQQIHHEHSDNSYYSGMNALSSSVYQNGKLATIHSQLVGKGDSKLALAKTHVDKLIREFSVEIFLFDSWYCKQPLLAHIQQQGKRFVSRARRNSKVLLGEEQQRLDALFRGMPHSPYEQIRVGERSFWIIDCTLELKAYGELRVIVSKDAAHTKPIFLVTNAFNFSAKFIVQLYLKRFAIEVFFKDAKQYLNFSTFLCRSPEKWELHFQLLQILHWALQRKNSISRTVRLIREDFNACLSHINRNPLIQRFFAELRAACGDWER